MLFVLVIAAELKKATVADVRNKSKYVADVRKKSKYGADVKEKV